MICLVLPGSLLVLASFFLLIIVLIKEDLPTLDFPTKTISGNPFVGYCFGETADISNLGSLINITNSSFLIGPPFNLGTVLFFKFFNLGTVLKFKNLKKRTVPHLKTTITAITIIAFIFCLVKTCNVNLFASTVLTNSQNLSNKKVCWGIKREDNHQQPDVGAVNKKLMEDFNGIYMGNSESKKVYLTFDAGYEAGYTEKILNVLKEKNVKACFFITAHYANTHPELVKRMIDEGHTIRQSYCKS